MVENRQLYLEPIAALIVLGFVFFACFKILLPFLGPILWSIVIVVATWPIYVKLKKRLGNRAKSATFVIIFGLALILVGPVGILTASLSEHIGKAANMVQDLTNAKLPEHPPQWVQKLPIVHSWIENIWHEAATDMQGFVGKIQPQIRTVFTWLLAQGAQLGLVLLQFLLVLLISAVIFPSGEILAQYVRAFSLRLGGAQGVSTLDAAAQTIQKVSVGVIGTAAIQALLSGFGFWLADVPAWVLLTFFCFFITLLQLGTGLVWIPVAIWLVYQDARGWAIFTAVWGIFINVIDNVIKPYLISKGGKLPIALIFMGVIGGLLTFGIIGIFLGPTLLAVGYNLIKLWLSSELSNTVSAEK